MSGKKHFCGMKDLPIGDYVKSFLGSHGSVKCLMREEGFFFFKSASTLVENLDIEHPIFQYIVNVSQDYRKIYGAQSADELLFYIHSWCRAASQLCEMGIPMEHVLQHMEDILSDIIKYIDTIKWTVSNRLTMPSGRSSNEIRNQSGWLKSSNPGCNIDTGGLDSKKSEENRVNNVKVTEKSVKEQKSKLSGCNVEFSTDKLDTLSESRLLDEVNEFSETQKDINDFKECSNSNKDNEIVSSEEDDVSWFFDALDEKSDKMKHLKLVVNQNFGFAEQSDSKHICDETNVQPSHISCHSSNEVNQEDEVEGLKTLAGDRDNGIETIHLEMKNPVLDLSNTEDEDVSWFFDSSDKTNGECIDTSKNIRKDIEDTDKMEGQDYSDDIIEDLKKLKTDINNDIEMMTKTRKLDRNSEFGRYRANNCNGIDENDQEKNDEFDDCFKNPADGEQMKDEFDECFDNVTHKQAGRILDGSRSDLEEKEDEFSHVEIKFNANAEKFDSAIYAKDIKVQETEKQNKVPKSYNGVKIVSRTFPSQAHINDLGLQQCSHDFYKVKEKLSAFENFVNVSEAVDLDKNLNECEAHNYIHTDQNEQHDTHRKESKLNSAAAGLESDKSSSSEIKCVSATHETIRKSETTVNICSNPTLSSDSCSSQIKGINALLEKIKIQKEALEQKGINEHNEVKSDEAQNDEVHSETGNIKDPDVKNSVMKVIAENPLKIPDNSFSQKLGSSCLNSDKSSCLYSVETNRKLGQVDCHNSNMFSHSPHLNNSFNVKDISKVLDSVSDMIGSGVATSVTSKHKVLIRSRHMKSDEGVNENMGNLSIDASFTGNNVVDSDNVDTNKHVEAAGAGNININEDDDIELENISEGSRFCGRPKLNFHSRHLIDSSGDSSLSWKLTDSENLCDIETIRTYIEQLVNGINYKGDETVNKAVCDVIEKHSNDGNLRLDTKIVASHSMVGAYRAPYIIDGVVILASVSNMQALHKLHGQSYRALLVNGDLQMSFKHKGYKSIRSSHISTLSTFLNDLPKPEIWLKDILDVLEMLSVNVLLVKGKVSSDMHSVCESQNIVVMETVPYKLLLQLSEAAEADMLTYVTLATEMNLVEITRIHPLKSDWLDINVSEIDKHEVVVTLPRKNPLTVIISECSSVQADLKEKDFWNCLKKMSVVLDSRSLLPGDGKTEEKCIDFINGCIKNMRKDEMFYQRTNLMYRQHVLETMASIFQDFIHLVRYDEDESKWCTDCHKSKTETWKVAMETVYVIMKIDNLIVTGLTENLNKGTL